MPSHRSLATISFLIYGVLSCGGAESTSGSPGGLQLVVVSGDQQTATVGSTLPTQIVFQTSDIAGNPLGGEVVQFAVTDGGSIGAVQSAQTGADGRIRVNWTLGTKPKVQSLTATAL